MLFTLFQMIHYALVIYGYGLIIYILLSWFPGSRDTPFGEFLARFCEPYLEQFRKFIPPLGMIDISPIVAIIILHLARQGLWQFYGFLLRFV